VIEILAPLTAHEVLALGKTFESVTGTPLVDVIEKETSRLFE
jgi:hypothetical protein